MTDPDFNGLVFTEDDAHVLGLCVENGINPPQVPDDARASVFYIQDSIRKMRWMCIRFQHTDEDGYIGCGFPMSHPELQTMVAFAKLLSAYMDKCSGSIHSLTWEKRQEPSKN